MIDFQVAFDKLASLDCANEIAAFLQEQNIKACRCEPEKCPIAVFIKESTDLDNIYVDGASIDQWSYNRKGYKKLADLTTAMRAFVVSFDDGIFPELVAEDSP